MQLHSMKRVRRAQRNGLIGCLMAAALGCTAAAASAQTIYRQVDAEGNARYSDRVDVPAGAVESSAESPVVQPRPSIRGLAPQLSSRAGATDRKEADRRLLQAKRQLARGPDLQHGIPPTAERIPGERRRQRLIKLQRDVESAQARAFEVSASNYNPNAPSRTAPVPAIPGPPTSVPLVLAGGASPTPVVTR